MKRKNIVVISIAILICVTIISNLLFSIKSKRIVRYEQHLQALRIKDNGSIEDGNLVSHLPLINISTNGQKIPGFPIRNEKSEVDSYELGINGEEEIKVEVNIYDNKEAQNSIKNKEDLNSKALFRIRGNSSRSFDKSSYKISFIDENDNPVEHKVMGMEKGQKWALYGPFLDKTMIRNYMWHNLCAKIMGYAPNVRFCECYLDGNYKGLYIMMETIQKSENRVNIESYDKNSRVIPYMVKMDKFTEEADSLITFSYYTSHLDYMAGFTILYPGKSNLTDDVKQYIAKDISDFEKALYSYDFKDPKKGYAKYIDVDSWVDFYIIQEFLANNDMCSRSTYLYKDKGGKLTMGPVWDFNNVCNNYLSKEYSTEGFNFTQNRIWYEMLFKDENFVKKVQKRYKNLRKTYLNENYLIKYIDETVEYLGDAIQRNYKVWGYSFERENQTVRYEYLKPVERNPSNYDEAINQYKQFLVKRGKWLDDNIETLEQYCHSSKNKIYVK